MHGLKVHSKICVIEKSTQGKKRRYGFISTGNFNEDTAKVYTDYTLFTSNKKLIIIENIIIGVKYIFQYP